MRNAESFPKFNRPYGTKRASRFLPLIYQNFGDTVLAGSNGQQTVVHGVIDSTPSRALTLEFFANQSCDPSDYGEGEQFLATAVVTTDAAGHAAFTVNLPQTVPTEQALTATATYVLNQFGNGDKSSEFSRCRPVAGVINGHLQATAVATSYDPTSVAGALAGVFTLRATFVNQHGAALSDLFFKVATLTNNNVLRNAAGAPGGAGAVVAVPGTIATGAAFAVEFHIGLQTPTPFTFLVDSYGITDGLAASAATAAATGFGYLATVDDLQPAGAQTDAIYLPLIAR